MKNGHTGELTAQNSPKKRNESACETIKGGESQRVYSLSYSGRHSTSVTKKSVYICERLYINNRKWSLPVEQIFEQSRASILDSLSLA